MGNVVVIEDDKDTLYLMEYVLAEAGYNVEGYNNLDSFEQIIGKEPSVLLLDNSLPGGYGDSLCFSLKSNPSTNHIPIILISAAYDLEELAGKCKADAFIPKPFDLDALISTVGRFASLSDFNLS
jgi:DNA-binding response OmpR family regulator